MTTTRPALERPATAADAAAVLAQARIARPVGGRTKQSWGAIGAPPEVELSTERLDTLVEHNEGDLTAILQAGVRLEEAQQTFSRAGQRLALDPPDPGARATLGGVVATADSGPLRHRYGAVRDLILGVQVALPDGTVARAGSRVIKNVAGYDLAKLMCGAFGTLGLICEVIVRLHPDPAERASVVGWSGDMAALAGVARTLAGLPLELEALDVRRDGERGAVLAQAAGRTAETAAATVERVFAEAGLHTEVVSDDASLWRAQRERQRAATVDGAIARVAFPPAELERILGAAPNLVARAGVGLAWIPIEPEPDALDELRRRVAPCAAVLEDAPGSLRGAVDVWGMSDGPELALMERVKLRFDPQRVCNPGCFLGGL
jgi:glycolate dehydrogenase FAD-binding subunit